MTDRQCGACDHPTHDNRVICNRCETQTSYALGDMEAHRQELETVLAKQTRYQPQSDGGRASDPNLGWSQIGEQFLEDVDLARHPVPYGRRAANVLHAQRGLLVAWCRLLNDDMAAPLPPDTIHGMSDHLRHWVPVLAKHEAGGDLVREVRQLVSSVIVAIDSPQFKRVIATGPCPQDYGTLDKHDWCQGKTTAVYPADEARRNFLFCDTCQAVWYAEQWHGVGSRIKQREEAMRVA